MPKLYITEISSFGMDWTGKPVQIPKAPFERDYSIDISTASRQSDKFGKKTVIVAVVADEDCWISWGPDPTATEESGFLPAGAERVVCVNPGDCLAVITLVDT